MQDERIWEGDVEGDARLAGAAAAPLPVGKCRHIQIQNRHIQVQSGQTMLKNHQTYLDSNATMRSMKPTGLRLLYADITSLPRAESRRCWKASSTARRRFKRFTGYTYFYEKLLPGTKAYLHEHSGLSGGKKIRVVYIKHIEYLYRVFTINFN